MLPMWIMRDTFFANYRENGGTDVPVCKGAGNPAGKPAVYAGNSTDFLHRPGPLLCRIVYSDHSVKKNEEKACSPGRYLVK